jgi:5-methylcytosine-specific restriction endonuclease McrA
MDSISRWRKGARIRTKIHVAKKMCSDCKIIKDREDFHKDSVSKDGLQRYCKKCFSIRKHNSNVKSREKIRQYNKKQHALYRQSQEFVLANREKVKRWVKKFPEKRKTIAMNYRSRKYKLPSNFSADDKADTEEMFKNKCAFCGITGVPMTMEHIVPISRRDVLNPGTVRGNMIPLCRPCNSSKHDKLLEEYLLDERLLRPEIKAYLRSRGMSGKELAEEIRYSLDVLAKT